jgi:hypothetical protein
MVGGLPNLGNTCYLNAALQCLLFAPPVTNYVLAGLADADLARRRVNACALATAYSALVRAYWTPRDPAAQGEIPADGGVREALERVRAALYKLHRPLASREPQDAHEALTAMVRHLHDAWGRTPRVRGSLAWDHVDQAAWETACAKGGYSMLTEVFQGQEARAVETAAGPGAPGGPAAPAGRSVGHEHFTGVSLDVRPTLEESIAAYLAPEPVEGYLVDGQPRDALLRREFSYAPLVLLVQLKRFDPAGGKVDSPVAYPLRLALPGPGPGGEPGGGGQYALYGVCYHRGGHYTAACEANGRWYAMDDEVVTAIDPGELATEQARRDAYVLAYKKVLADGT